MSNYVAMDITNRQYDARMAPECLDQEGEEWSDGLVQPSLPKLLYNIQWTKQQAIGSPGMLKASPEESQRLYKVVELGFHEVVVKDSI